MPLVYCPACGRHINLPDAEMSLPSIQCARCDNHFCPATGEVSPRGQTAVALPDTTREEPASRLPQTIPDSPAPRVQRGTLVACGILVGVLVLGVVLLVVVLRRNSPSGALDRGTAQGEGNDDGAHGKGRPAPGNGGEAKGAILEELELVRRYILNNTKDDDAKEVRFLAWGPHMDGTELAALAKEAGASPVELMVQITLARWSSEALLSQPFSLSFGQNQDFRLMVRVRYQAPNKLWEMIPPGEALNEPTKQWLGEKVKTYDWLYFVAGKFVRPLGEAKGGDNWKKELRRDLSKTYPAIRR